MRFARVAHGCVGGGVADRIGEWRRWWQLTDSMQESLVPGATGSGQATPWWLSLDEVFRFEGKA